MNITIYKYYTTPNNDTRTVVISGAIVLIIGHLVQKFLLQPYADFYKAKSNMRATLFLYRRTFMASSPAKELRIEADRETRKAMVKLEAQYYFLPIRHSISHLSKLGIPTETSFQEALGLALGLVNGTNDYEDRQLAKKDFDKLLDLLIYRLPRNKDKPV